MKFCQLNREPGNAMDKYEVSVKKNNEIVGHLPFSEVGNFVKTISYFLRAGEYGDVLIRGTPFNLGDGNRIHVPCTLNFTSWKKFFNILKSTLKFCKIYGL